MNYYDGRIIAIGEGYLYEGRTYACKRGGGGLIPIAFVSINTETGSVSEVLEAIGKIDAVEEAHMVYGVYDVVAKVKADTMGQLKEIATWQVRRLNKVSSTTTITRARNTT